MRLMRCLTEERLLCAPLPLVQKSFWKSKTPASASLPRISPKYLIPSLRPKTWDAEQGSVSPFVMVLYLSMVAASMHGQPLVLGPPSLSRYPKRAIKFSERQLADSVRESNSERNTRRKITDCRRRGE